MRKYRASRFKQLIFPQELIIDRFHVLSRKRHFPAFWRVTEESIPLSKLASIQLQRGMFFSKIIIENAGGPYPITVDGLWNRTAHEARDLLEMIEREMQMREEGIDDLVGGEGPPPSEGPTRGRSPQPRDTGFPPPPPPPSDAPVPSLHVSSGYQPGSPGDRERLQQIARDLVDKGNETQASLKMSPMAAHYATIRDMKESIEPPQHHETLETEPVQPQQSAPQHNVAVAEDIRCETYSASADNLVDWWKNVKEENEEFTRSKRRRRELE